MLTRAAFAALLAALLPISAGAQPSPGGEAQISQRMADELQKKLSEQGFSEVKIVPGSFIVTAKDKDGEPVAMLIGPHSSMVFTPRSHDPDRETEQAEVPDPAGGKSKWY